MDSARAKGIFESYKAVDLIYEVDGNFFTSKVHAENEANRGNIKNRTINEVKRSDVIKPKAKRTPKKKATEPKNEGE